MDYNLNKVKYIGLWNQTIVYWKVTTGKLLILGIPVDLLKVFLVPLPENDGVEQTGSYRIPLFH